MDFEEQAQRLRTHVEQLASDIGERNVFRPTSLQAAASYVEHEWEHQGYAVERLAYDVSGVRCLNLEITHSGGARDREEPPFFMTRRQGSTVYAEAARRRGDDIRLMASIETIGWYSSEPGSQSYRPLFNLFYPNRADFIGIVSNFRSRAAMRRLAAAFRANSDFPLETAATFSFIPGVSWSDHRSFWRQGYRAVMITDTAFHRYRYYHAPSDMPDKLAYPELARVTSGLFAAFSELARGGAD